MVPKQTKQVRLENQLPIDLSLLLIKRNDAKSFTNFIIHYHGETFNQEQLDTPMISKMYSTMSISDYHDKFISANLNLEMFSNIEKDKGKKSVLNHLSERAVDSILVN